MEPRLVAANARVSVRGPGQSALYWMALGMFAIGTEGFMIAAILPKIAADLSVSVAAAGSLVSIFALSYALSSPVLTALTGKLDRRRLLLGSMGAFALANVFAATTRSYWALATARALLAFAAGLYAPNANALAGALVPPERRGRAIAIVNGGLTVAIAIGVPLGGIVGNRIGWRMNFVGVAILAALAVAGLLFGLPARVGAGMVTATLRERLRVVRQPKVASALLVTTIWAVGSYAVYTFIASFLAVATLLRGPQVGYALFLWGISAGVGLMIGGNATDKLGIGIVIRVSLSALALALAGLSVLAHALTPGTALVPVLLAMILWGLSAWAFYPAQQARLIDIAGVRLAPIALSLNASFMYLGFSIGAALGGFTLLHAAAINLGWLGAGCEVVALTLFVVSRVSSSSDSPRRERARSVRSAPGCVAPSRPELPPGATTR
jgi:predicted MFS family arabinose efflux permease